MNNLKVVWICLFLFSCINLFSYEIVKIKAFNLTINMVKIASGTFKMGSDWGVNPLNIYSNKGYYKIEQPVHVVKISKGYLISETEVTHIMYEKVMNYSKRQENSVDDNAYNVKDNDPVNFVSWDDANRFCDKLSLIIKRKVRLPTEAEWEYACKAGTDTPFYWGNSTDMKLARKYANFQYDDKLKHPKEVKSFQPNSWGLYDMSGNVWEWCADWFDKYPNESESVDPKEPNKVNYSVKSVRGGSCYDGLYGIRSSARYGYAKDDRYYNIGFRIVVEED